MNDFDRFDEQFRETLTERNERLRTSRLKKSIRTLQTLIADMSDDLRDEGCDRSVEGLQEIRRRVAMALPPDLCPEWLKPFCDERLVQS